MLKTFGQFLILLLATFATATAVGASRLCSVQHAADLENSAHAKRSLPVIERAGRVAKDLEALIDSHPWKDGVPMNQQMTADEASKFGELTQAQKISLFAMLIESKRERDIRVIARMSRLGDQVYRYGFETPTDKDSEDALLLGVVMSLDQAIDRKGAPAPLDDDVADEGCTLSYALRLAAGDALRDLTSMPGYAEWLSKADVYKRYAPEQDTAKMTASEREYYRSKFEPMAKVVRNGFWYTYTLLKLALLEDTSKKMLESLRVDHYESPADLAYSGTNWKRWVSDGRISDSQNKASGIINFIADKIPTEMLEELGAK